MSKYQKINKIDGTYIFQSYEKPLRTKIYDLEKENEQLKKEIAEKEQEITTYKEVLETYKKKPVNIYQVEIRNLQVDKAELKLELEEKDKEIEDLKDKLKRTEKTMYKEVKEHLDTIVDLNQLRQENEKLKKKIAELEEDWQEELYEMQRAENHYLVEIKKLKKQLTEKEQYLCYKICEKIREKAEYKNWSKAVPFVYVIKPEILDQIEGEK